MSGLALPILGGALMRRFGDARAYDYHYWHVARATASLEKYSNAVYAAQFHAGTDYSGGDGLVRAPEAMHILFAGPAIPGSAEDGGGLIVEGRITGGMNTVACHMDILHVSSGGNVGRGQVIGRMDSTGRATGPHVHQQLYTVIGTGQRLFWNFEDFLPGGIHAESTLIRPIAYATKWEPFPTRRRVTIAPGATVHKYSPSHPGGPVLPNYVAPKLGSSFWSDGYMTVSWPGDSTPPIPHGRFLHGDATRNPATGRQYGGVFAGWLVAPSEVHLV